MPPALPFLGVGCFPILGRYAPIIWGSVQYRRAAAQSSSPTLQRPP
ncbi:MAG: hypothetical protein K2L93_04390 [Muribaculaceae bacterium]|nr:hypothetical protein [Muribaculaceae bacterium]MDE6321517.1 hypothetical protein [Muribaculaceae bacterium]